MFSLLLFLFLLIAQNINILASQDTIKSHCLSLIGTPYYHSEFTHFRYVNEQAPKGGTLRLSALGSFNTFNPFNNKGTPPAHIQHTLYDRLMSRAWDEPYSLYPLIAETLEYPPDYAWVAFNINPKATFNDGSPITIEDIIYTFNVLKEKGAIYMKTGLSLITKVVAAPPHRVVFHFGKERGIKSLALLGLLPVLPKKVWEKHDFENTLAIPITSSGPMRVKSFNMGTSITYEMMDNYWAKNLPVNKGQFNFKNISILYFRDIHAEKEAFKAQLTDLYIELDLKSWHTNFRFPAITRGEVICNDNEVLYPPGRPSFVFNIRKPVFKDIRVRQAISYLLDQQKISHMLLYNGSACANSYFTNSPLAAVGMPTEEEKKLLIPFKKHIPDTVLSTPLFTESNTTLSSYKKKSRAIKLLKEAGWTFKNNKMIHNKTEKQLSFQVLVSSPQDERIIMHFKKNLAHMGIDLQVQTLDPNHYMMRIRSFNFDMAHWVYRHSSFPGPELSYYWKSTSDFTNTGANFSGASSPAIDALLEKISTAKHFTDLLAPSRALDRVLRLSYFSIPLWYDPNSHLAYWNHIKRPSWNSTMWPLICPLWHKDHELNNRSGWKQQSYSMHNPP